MWHQPSSNNVTVTLNGDKANLHNEWNVNEKQKRTNYGRQFWLQFYIMIMYEGYWCTFNNGSSFRFNNAQIKLIQMKARKLRIYLRFFVL